MDKVDQFESLFKSASRPTFERADVRVGSVVVACDGDAEAARAYADRVRSFLAVLGGNVRWRDVAGTTFGNVTELLAIIEEEDPDLVCTHRHLNSPHRRWPSTLGGYVDVLTQEMDRPLLLLPHPGADEVRDFAGRDTSAVMVLTNHLPKDAGLVNLALRLTVARGRLILAHVEDDAVFDRFLDVISRIPEIDTDLARAALRAQLEKEPADWIRSVATVLREAGVPVTVEPSVTFGHHLKTCRRLVEAHGAGLLVIHTRDEDQLAMHGLAYPLAVDLREIPLLLA